MKLKEYFCCSTLSQNFGFTTNISTIPCFLDLRKLKTVGGNEKWNSGACCGMNPPFSGAETTKTTPKDHILLVSATVVRNLIRQGGLTFPDAWDGFYLELGTWLVGEDQRACRSYQEPHTGRQHTEHSALCTGSLSRVINGNSVLGNRVLRVFWKGLLSVARNMGMSREGAIMNTVSK